MTDGTFYFKEFDFIDFDQVQLKNFFEKYYPCQEFLFLEILKLKKENQELKKTLYKHLGIQ